MQLEMPPAPKLVPFEGPARDEVKITIGDADYILIPHETNFLNCPETNDVSLALVYLTHPGRHISGAALREFRENALNHDDVFRSEFFKNVIFYGSPVDSVIFESGAKAELDSWGTKSTEFIAGDKSAKTAPGPYVLTKGKTWQPWKVCYDFNATLMKAFKPSPENPEIIALDASEAGTNERVIVPSRCYFAPSKSRPLDGVRITVKDNIDIAGHKTTLCNRAWQDLYPAKTKHAACVQVLVDAGAIIVGKAKLMAMIMREEPLECVEFTAPFNPRGDRYQISSGSSHGSAAGIASYDWLDFSLGSDTNGSGRKPAHYNGCFSIRPSTGIMKTEGVAGQFPEFDMPVFFGRDISKFHDFISVWYGDSPKLRTPSNLPVKILYPKDYLPTVNKAQTELIDKFVDGLESALHPAKRTAISLAEMWKKDCPDGPGNADLAEYLEKTGSYPYYHDAYHALEPFKQEYTEKFGKAPFIHRAMQWQWSVAKTITEDERNFYWNRSEIYRKWLLEKVFEHDAKDKMTIMVLPILDGKPTYRDAELPPYYILSGYSSLNMSPMMRAPEVTAIVGEIEYDSIVTERREPMPIAVSVIGAPGTDLCLVDLVQKGMKAAEIPTQVKTGRSVYGTSSEKP